MFQLAVNWEATIRDSRFWLNFLAPECILIVAACAAILFDLRLNRERSGRLLAWVALGGTVGALVSVYRMFYMDHPEMAFWGAVAIDKFACFFKLVILFGTIFSVVLVHESRELRDRPMGEFYGLLLTAVAGMCLMVSATDMVTAFLAIETVSVPSFALVAYLRRDRRCTEAALKYVLYSAFATGCMLFGLSLLFGLTGSTSFGALRSIDTATNVGAITVGVGCLLAFAGFAFKMAAAPFHFWAPDVYQGAPTPVTAWLSVTSKAAGVGLFVRFIAAFMGFTDAKGERIAGGALNLHGFDWVTALIVIACVTMTIGNFGALWQTSMKRLLAYSSVAHVGYILMGIAAIQGVPSSVEPSISVSLAMPAAGTNGVLTESSGGAATAFYIAAYLFMNLGAFACVIAVSNCTGSDELSSFRALGRRSPALALALAIFAFALIGLPPTAGFTGKLQLFMAAIERAQHRPGFWWLVGVAGVNSVVGVYYYLKIAKVMYLEGLTDPEAREPLPVSPGLTLVSLFLVIPVLGFGLAFNRIAELTMNLELLLRSQS